MKRPWLLIGLCVLPILAIAFGVARFMTHRRQAARDTFARVIELARRGEWDEAFQFTHPDYRQFANVTNLRGGFSGSTNASGRFDSSFKVSGGWKAVQIRLAYQAQPNWGAFVELRELNGVWLIRDAGTWSNSDF